MLRYTLRTSQLGEILTLCSHVLNVRTTFFDAQHEELTGLDIKARSAYCRALRRDAAQDAACRACDREHLCAARSAGRIQVYRCHRGLLEAAVPLQDPQGEYAGAVVFGQLRLLAWIRMAPFRANNSSPKLEA